MKRTTLLLLSLLVFSSAATTQPSGPGPAVGRDGWYAWKVPIAGNVKICCWERGGGCCGNCSLTGGQGFTTTDDVKVKSSGQMLVAVRMSGGKLNRVRAFDGDCAIDTGTVTLHRLDNVSVSGSLAFLMEHVDDLSDESAAIAVIAQHESPEVPAMLVRLASAPYRSGVREDAVFWVGQRGGEYGFRFLRDLVRGNEGREMQKKAVFAISQSEVPAATTELIDLARNHKSSDIRRESIFWLGQKAGEKAASELRRAVDEDPDDDVREHAVFAISQLPRDRSVPLLIDLVRTHKSANVREKALFWLGQTGDPRAIDLIEEILMK